MPSCVPRRMRPFSRFSGILYVGIAVCIVGAVVVAILLGALDRPPGWRAD